MLFHTEQHTIYYKFIMSISNWPEAQRPRERLLSMGAAALSDAELVAIFLRIGVKGKNAVELGHEMLAHFGSLNGLFSAPIGEFSSIHGLGTAKFVQLQAVLELAKRALTEKLEQGDTLNSPQLVKQYLQLAIGSKPHESFMVLFMDVNNRLIRSEEMFRGGLSHASVYPREIVIRALYHNAAAVIFAHNHPSGHSTPSAADISLTISLKATLALVEVKVLDHFVVAGNNVHSFAEHGQI